MKTNKGYPIKPDALRSPKEIEERIANVRNNRTAYLEYEYAPKDESAAYKRQEIGGLYQELHTTKRVLDRLDRISRDLEFVASLMKNPKVSFKVATQPNADNFTLAIYAAISMKEREMISIRTRNSLQALKRSGKRLGVAGSRNIKKANEVKKQQACKFASKLKPVIQPLRNQGKTYQQIANILNEMGCTTAQGKSFQPIQVSRIMEREVVGI